MRYIFLSACILFLNCSFGQTETTLTTIDFVKIKNNKRPEALYYYENNWKVYRDIALKNDYIKSYKILSTSADSTANFDLILITEYSDSSQFKLNEERFQQIIKSIRPDGPLLLNELKPNEFRQIVFFKTTETLYDADKTAIRKKRK